MLLLQGLLNCTSVFRESIADLSFCLADLLCVTFGAMDHVDDVSGCAAYAMSCLSFFTCGEKGVRRGSFFHKRTRLHRFLLQRKILGV